MGKENAESYGKRNAGKGELLIRVKPTNKNYCPQRSCRMRNKMQQQMIISRNNKKIALLYYLAACVKKKRQGRERREKKENTRLHLRAALQPLLQLIYQQVPVALRTLQDIMAAA